MATYVYLLYKDTSDFESSEEVLSVHATVKGAQKAVWPHVQEPDNERAVKPRWQRPRHTKFTWRLRVPATFGRFGQEFFITRERVQP